MALSKFALLVLAAVIFAGSAHAAPNKQYPPRDDCLRIGEYFQFRQQFEDIVKRRNTAGLQALIASDIQWNFGGEPATKTAFAAKWNLSKGAASPIWAELDAILPLGCGINGKGIAFPHMFTAGLGDQDGELSKVLVTYEDVNLRASASSGAVSKAKISWELVDVKGGIVKDGWTPVTTADGKTGFIKSNYLRDPLDYRAGFEKRDGKWVMNFFAAGD
jgi:hypothetical protein